MLEWYFNVQGRKLCTRRLACAVQTLMSSHYSAPLTHQPASRRAWARGRTAGSRARAGPVEPPADGGCTWRSASSWRGGNTRSRRSAACSQCEICKQNGHRESSFKGFPAFSLHPLHSPTRLFTAHLTAIQIQQEKTRNPVHRTFHSNPSWCVMFWPATSAAFIHI